MALRTVHRDPNMYNGLFKICSCIRKLAVAKTIIRQQQEEVKVDFFEGCYNLSSTEVVLITVLHVDCLLSKYIYCKISWVFPPPPI